MIDFLNKQLEDLFSSPNNALRQQIEHDVRRTDLNICFDMIEMRITELFFVPKWLVIAIDVLPFLIYPIKLNHVNKP